MFDIVKGWPCEGAIDEQFVKATGATLNFGDIAWIVSGKAAKADFAGGENAVVDAVYGVVLDVDKVTDKVAVLLSECLVECDSSHYTTASYVPGLAVSAAGGKFTPAIDPGAEPASTRAVGTITSYNSVTGIMRVLVGRVSEIYLVPFVPQNG
jgi:hypothetical protein